MEAIIFMFGFVALFWIIDLIIGQTKWFNWLANKMFGTKRERGELEWLDNYDGMKIIKRRKR